MIENLLEGIFHDPKVKEVLSVISSEGKDQVINVIKIFQTPFLALCLGLPSDMVNVVLPVLRSGNVPKDILQELYHVFKKRLKKSN